jgi:GT2 family glycosyltransferase
MGAPPRVSVVIPAYRRMDLLERTIACLLAQDYPPAHCEVVVVDHPGGGAAEVVRRAATPDGPTVRLLPDAPVQAMHKRNLGAAAATGDYVLFVNDDIWAEPGLVAEHVRAHAAYAPGPVAVLGHVEQSPEMPYSPFVEAYRPYAYEELAGCAGRPVKWWYFYAPNVSLPRRTLLEGGFRFREDWPELVHEDVELGYRWARAGYNLIYNPGARAQHFHPHTLASACRLQESIGRHLPRLERLVDEPHLLERYGVFSWRNRPRAVLRGLVRQALFNAATLPLVERWLGRQARNTDVSRWLYWKVLLHYTNLGYRQGLAASGPPRPARPAGKVRRARAGGR